MFDDFLSLILAVVLIGGFVIGVFWWSAGQESDAYFRATGKKIPQWDAMFLELRIQND